MQKLDHAMKIDNDEKIFELVTTLRSMGCAVAFFTPDQLEHVDATWIESAMLDRGMRYLEHELGYNYNPPWPFNVDDLLPDEDEQ